MNSEKNNLQLGVKIKHFRNNAKKWKLNIKQNKPKEAKCPQNTAQQKTSTGYIMVTGHI